MAKCSIYHFWTRMPTCKWTVRLRARRRHLRRRPRRTAVRTTPTATTIKIETLLRRLATMTRTSIWTTLTLTSPVRRAIPSRTISVVWRQIRTPLKLIKPVLIRRRRPPARPPWTLSWIRFMRLSVNRRPLMRINHPVKLAKVRPTIFFSLDSLNFPFKCI